MATITEDSIVDAITALPDRKHVETRTLTRILRDGQEISRSYSRRSWAENERAELAALLGAEATDQAAALAGWGA